ncbi:MAG TPA: glycosyltransferase [Casimicrobiaceae bacterium]|nr:glycosyltransferase [Casimicrobiaceae bacterium]
MSIVHTEASTGWGGQEIRILTEAAGLRQRGHDVRVLASPGARIAEEASRFGVPIDVLPIGRKRPDGLFALRRALGGRAIDIVNSHSSTDSWLAALSCRLLALGGRRAPVLVRTRHVSVAVPNDAATRWLYRKATARVITTGESLRAQLVRDNGLDPNRIDSVPTGVDGSRYGLIERAEARAKLRLPQGVPLVGIVATLRSWKGHRFLIDSLPLVKRRDARLVIVGDGPQRKALEEQVDATGLRDRVLLAGQQSDVTEWLAALDVFVLPSYANEGVPQALVQAMFASIPVITTDVGAIPEIARDGDTATIIARENPTAIATAIDALLGDPARAKAQAQRARAFVSTRYTLAAMLDRMEASFRKALLQA